MRLGVTGRNRTGIHGVTFHNSAVELRPHPSARLRDKSELAPRRGIEPRTSWVTTRHAANCAIGDPSGAKRGLRSPDARAFNAPLYQLSYLSKKTDISRTTPNSTSAVPKRERPVGRGVSLHVAWPGPRTSRTANTMSRGNGVSGYTRSEADGHHPQSKRQGEPSASTGLTSRQIVKEFPPLLVAVRSVDHATSGDAPAGTGLKIKKGPDPCQIRAPANRDWKVCAYALPSPGCNRPSFRSRR